MKKGGLNSPPFFRVAGRLSRRGATRVHRLAWTVADLRGRARPGMEEVDTALRLRLGDPLLLSMLERAG